MNLCPNILHVIYVYEASALSPDCYGSVQHLINVTNPASAGDAKPLKKPPTWLRRPSGACFGFGGRLVSFNNHVQQLTDPMTGQVRPVETGTVNITQVVTEHQLVEHSEAFENAIAGRDRTALQVGRVVPLLAPSLMTVKSSGAPVALPGAPHVAALAGNLTGQTSVPAADH